MARADGVSGARRPRLVGEHTAATRSSVLHSARGLFAVHGYEATSLDRIAEDAGVTKGAVYHHFASKRELFRTLYEQLALDLRDRLLVGLAGLADPVAKVHRGAEILLDSAEQPEMRAIFFRDGVVALRGEAREIDERTFLALLRELLDDLVRAGSLESFDTAMLSRLILSLLIESAVQLGQATDLAATRSALRAILERMLFDLIRPVAVSEQDPNNS